MIRRDDIRVEVLIGATDCGKIVAVNLVVAGERDRMAIPVSTVVGRPEGDVDVGGAASGSFTRGCDCTQVLALGHGLSRGQTGGESSMKIGEGIAIA